jgi:DNA repair exonuclease SbcCD ATPase subunit
MEMRTAELKQAQESMHGAYAAANAELDRQKGIHARNCFKRNKLHEELTAQTQAKLKVARELAEVVAKLDATRASAADAERQLQSKKAAAAEARAALSEQQAALEQLESAAAALAECHRRDVEALQRKHEAALAQLQARPSSPPPRVLAEKQREWQRAFREVNRAHDEQMAELERQLSEAGRAVAKAKA